MCILPFILQVTKQSYPYATDKEMSLSDCVLQGRISTWLSTEVHAYFQITLCTVVSFVIS